MYLSGCLILRINRCQFCCRSDGRCFFLEHRPMSDPIRWVDINNALKNANSCWIPLNAAISIDVVLFAAGRSQIFGTRRAHGRNLLHECTLVPVPLTLSIPRTGTQVPMRGDFRRRNVRFFAPLDPFYHPFLSNPLKFFLQMYCSNYRRFCYSLIYHSSDFITFIYALFEKYPEIVPFCKRRKNQSFNLTPN